MSEALTPQQQMVLAQKEQHLARLTSTGDHLDGKAATILQAGGLIIALVGAVSVPTFVYAPSNGWQLSAVACAFLAFLGMLLAALQAWHPSAITHPGNLNWDETFNDYLNETVDGCYNQVLSDILSTSEDAKVRNRIKARWVKIALYLFGLQIAAVLALALATAG